MVIVMGVSHRKKVRGRESERVTKDGKEYLQCFFNMFCNCDPGFLGAFVRDTQIFAEPCGSRFGAAGDCGKIRGTRDQLIKWNFAKTSLSDQILSSLLTVTTLTSNILHIKGKMNTVPAATCSLQCVLHLQNYTASLDEKPLTVEYI